MSECVICQERPAEIGNACERDAGRLSGALRQIPDLCVKIAEDVEAIEADYGERVRRFVVGGEVRVQRYRVVPDPVAHALPAASIPRRGAPRVTGTRERSLPIRVDASDLLAPAHPGERIRDTLIPKIAAYPTDEFDHLSVWSRVVLQRRWVREVVRDAFGQAVMVPAGDQTGHMSVEGWLASWAAYWAQLRGMREHPPTGRAALCGWLAERLDWALTFDGLPDFAAELSVLFGALLGLAYGGEQRPKVMKAPCPECDYPTLIQPWPDASIECGTEGCDGLLSPVEYAEHVRSLIEAGQESAYPDLGQ